MLFRQRYMVRIYNLWHGFLTFCDFISNSILLPVVAFLTCIMIGWFVGADYIIAEATKTAKPSSAKIFTA